MTNYPMKMWIYVASLLMGLAVLGCGGNSDTTQLPEPEGQSQLDPPEV